MSNRTPVTRSTQRTGEARARSAATVAAERNAPAAGAPPDRLVLGAVPVAARIVGLLLALAGIFGVVAVFPTYLVVGGVDLSLATGPLDVLVAVLAPLVAVAVGIGLALGKVPRFGLAYAGVAGSLAIGRLLIELHQGTASTTRPGVEVLAGDLVVTSSVQTAPGWLIGVLALGLTVIAGVVALTAWGRTIMEDGGGLDRVRPVLAGTAVLLGVGSVLCLALPAADVPDRLITDPSTGLVTVVTAEGPRALLERPGLALLGGLLLAGALLLSAVVAPSLRPRLGAVGGLLAVAVAITDAGLAGLRDALHSPDLEWTLPGIGLLVLGLGTLGLTVLTWRWQPRAGPTEGEEGNERFVRGRWPRRSARAVRERPEL